MTKQQITIEIDVPEGWEFVRYGMPKAGEHWLDGCRMIHCAAFDYQDTACVIIQNAWQWPAWLKVDWVVQQKDGLWWAVEAEPQLHNSAWGTRESSYWFALHMTDFTPPPCTDWQQSKRRRPGS